MIAIDIDDTVAAYVQGFVKEYGWPETFEKQDPEMGILRTNWPQVDIDAHLQDSNHIPFCMNLLPIDGAANACHILLRTGLPIMYVTARQRSHKESLVEWLHHWGFPVAPTYCTGSNEAKNLLVANLDFSAVIDDRAEFIYSARDTGLATFIMDRPWNRDVPGLYRCFGWTHILESIDTYWLPLG